MAYVYRHIRLDKNQPFYIGIGTSKYYNRAYRYKNRSELWKKVAHKGGYEVEILMDNLTWEQACEKEKEFIALYGRINLKTGCLVNMTDGGDGTLNAIISEKHKKSISEANKRRVFTDDDRKKMAERMTERNNDPELRAKIAEGIRKSEKFKEAASKNAKKYKGFKHSEKSRKNMAKAKSKPLCQKTLDGELIKIWDSAKQVQRETLFSQGNISNCCNGKYKQSYGFKWEYYKQ
jgi:hypothetical protein